MYLQDFVESVSYNSTYLLQIAFVDLSKNVSFIFNLVFET